MDKRITPALTLMLLAILNGNAQQPTSAYQFKPVFIVGMEIGGQFLRLNTTVEGLTLNDYGEVAAVLHWNEGDRQRSAVITSRRLIARDGDVLNGKALTRIVATSLSLSGSGQVAFEAEYGNPGQTGIFVERKFIEALSVSGSPDDFTLSEDGKVTLKAAVAVPAAPAATAPWNNRAVQNAIRLKIPSSMRGVIFDRNSPISGADPNVILQPTRPAAPRPQQQVQAGRAAPASAPRACPAPEFAMPASWAVGDAMGGPVASHMFEAPAKGRVYESRLFGPMGSPFRVIQFNADCKPLLIVIGDNFLRDRFEFWSPNGLITRTLPDGTLDLKGFNGKVLPGPLARADTVMHINKHGQILLPVSLEPDGAFAILLATPTGGPR